MNTPMIKISNIISQNNGNDEIDVMIWACTGDGVPLTGYEETVQLSTQDVHDALNSMNPTMSLKTLVMAQVDPMLWNLENIQAVIDNNMLAKQTVELANTQLPISWDLM